MADHEIKADKDEKALSVSPQHFEQFVLHALDCSDPNCPFSLCVNTKLMFKHTQRCTSVNCPICQQARSLALNHSKTCQEYFCCVPFCMEAKLTTFVESQIIEQSTRHAENSLDCVSQTQGTTKNPLNENGSLNIEAGSHLFEQKSPEGNSIHLPEQTPLCPRRVRSSSLNLNSSAQKSSPSLKRLNTESSSLKASKTSSNWSDQKTTLSSRVNTEERPYPSLGSLNIEAGSHLFEQPSPEGNTMHLPEQTSMCPRRVRSSSLNLNSSAQKSSPSLKRLKTRSSSLKASKTLSNWSVSNDQKTTLSSRVDTEERRYPSQTTSPDHQQRDIFKDPFRGSQEGPVTIMVKQTENINQGNSGTQTKCLRENSLACSDEQKRKYPNLQTEIRGKTVREQCNPTPVICKTSQHLQQQQQQQQQQSSQNSVRAEGLSLRSKSHKTGDRLLKRRFFHVLFGLQQLILNTKTRQEILICVGSLRGALQEIYNLDKAD